MSTRSDLHRLLARSGFDAAKAKRYSRVRVGLLLGGTALTLAEMGWFALSGRSARLRSAVRDAVPDTRLATPAYVATVTAAARLARLPWSYLAGHLVERRFGQTNQTTRSWIEDRAKGMALGLAIETPVLAATYAVIRRRPHDWWLLLATASVPLSVAFSTLAPVVLMPLFNRFERLDDEELVRRIVELAERAGVQVADVYRMDMSRQTEKANAFFTGLGRTKRIVLGDTLIGRFSADEIEAVIAHELGHQVHGDIWRMVALGGLYGYLAAFATSRLAPRLIERTAGRTAVVEIGDEASLPLLGITAAAIGAVLAPVQSAVSRAIERRTDQFALNLTQDGHAYASAMARLASRNLADPDPSKLVVFFLYDHPPMAERIACAESFAAARGDEW